MRCAADTGTRPRFATGDCEVPNLPSERFTSELLVTYREARSFMPACPQGFSTKCRLGDTICYAPAKSWGGAVGFPPSDSPVGDCRRCGDEPFGLRAERRPGTAAWAGRYSTSTRGLELAAAWTGGRGHIRCWAGRCSTGARRLERAVSWTGGRGHIRCAADAAGHHCEDRFRRARQSRGHAGSEKAVFPRPAAAVAVPAPRRSGSASRRRWLMSTPAWTIPISAAVAHSDLA
jgi:hypothetical protein